MCGRFAQTTSSDDLVNLFQLMTQVAITPCYNLAPTMNAFIVRETSAGRIGQQTRWGLVPSWAPNLKRGSDLFNARSESVFEKPSFAKLARTQRCVIPASGFYEWRDTPAGKMPTLFTPAHEPVLRFAGLWSTWADDHGEITYTSTILTTEANRTMAPFHHRMPVLLTSNGSDQWLNNSIQNPDDIRHVLVSAPNDALQLRPISRRINNVRNNDSDCWGPHSVDE